MIAPPEVRVATAEEVIDLLTEAFDGYPVMRHVLGDRERIPAVRRALVRLFVLQRELRSDPILRLEQGGEPLAAMTLTLPHSPGAVPAADVVAESTWTQLGDEARSRYRQFADAANAVDAGVPNLHVNMIGVLRAGRGRGLARILLEAAHRHSLQDRGSSGVSLTTENPANVPFYERLGYRVIGQRQIAEGFATWGFFRPDDPAAPIPTETGSSRF